MAKSMMGGGEGWAAYRPRDIAWKVKFGEPKKTTAEPEAGVLLVVEAKRHKGRPVWAATLFVDDKPLEGRSPLRDAGAAKDAAKALYVNWIAQGSQRPG